MCYFFRFIVIILDIDFNISSERLGAVQKIADKFQDFLFRSGAVRGRDESLLGGK